MEPRVAQCLLIAKVLVADGMITPDERVFLNAAIARFGLTPEERERVIELEGWEEAEKVVAAMNETDKRDFVDTLLTAASADGRLSPLELAVVKKISSALKLD
ncbi:MAG: TerB family tellurite resistance protein [Polyangiales bacterium]